MKTILKPFIFTALTCTFLLSAGIFVEAASKSSDVAINDTNFSEKLIIYAEDSDKNQDGYLSTQEAADITRISLDSNKNTDIFKGIQYFTELQTFKFNSYIDRRNRRRGKKDSTDIKSQRSGKTGKGNGGMLEFLSERN